MSNGDTGDQYTNDIQFVNAKRQYIVLKILSLTYWTFLNEEPDTLLGFVLLVCRCRWIHSYSISVFFIILFLNSFPYDWSDWCSLSIVQGFFYFYELRRLLLPTRCRDVLQILLPLPGHTCIEHLCKLPTYFDRIKI